MKAAKDHSIDFLSYSFRISPMVSLALMTAFVFGYTFFFYCFLKQQLNQRFLFRSLLNRAMVRNTY